MDCTYVNRDCRLPGLIHPARTYTRAGRAAGAVVVEEDDGGRRGEGAGRTVAAAAILLTVELAVDAVRVAAAAMPLAVELAHVQALA